MAAFPSVWELLLPNLNIWTILGIVLIVLGVLIIKGTFALNFVGIDISKYGGLAVIVGIFLIWGVSMIQDFLNSEGGQLVFWGSVVVLVLGVILFYDPKKKKKGGRKR